MRKLNNGIARRGEEGQGASEQTRPVVLGGPENDYRKEPGRFAREVLGSCWWEAQEEIAAALAQHRRVAVKAANGVGKTYLAADLALWFLYSFQPSVVLTTAPTWRQVETLLTVKPLAGSGASSTR